MGANKLQIRPKAESLSMRAVGASEESREHSKKMSSENSSDITPSLVSSSLLENTSEQVDAISASSFSAGIALKTRIPISETVEANRTGILAEPILVSLGNEYIDEVCRLESRSYPSPWSSSLVRGEFEKNVSLRLGLKVGKELVAYSFNYIVVDELHVLNVAVAPEWRNQGFGKRLLGAVIRTGIERGAHYATLEVRMSNVVAQQLYESFGFRVSGRRRAYYRNNGEDALVMERAL